MQPRLPRDGHGRREGEADAEIEDGSHVGVTTVIMLLALRTRSKGLIFTILPFYVAMCFSTVYIYAHYAIDAIAGLITGTLLYFSLINIWKKYSISNQQP